MNISVNRFPAAAMIRVLVVEDHVNIIVPGLKNLFRPERDGMSIACAATSPREAVKNIHGDEFDVVLLDLHFPGVLPNESIDLIVNGFPGKPVIIYTMETASFWRYYMMKRGIVAYLNKDCPRDELKKAFLLAVSFESRELQKDQVEALVDTPADSYLSALSPVKREIALLLSQGCDRTEIARSMGMHPSSVDKTLKSLRDRFQCNNNVSLIRFLIEHGMV